MKVFLTKQCESFTGSLGRGFGYHIQHRKNGFFAKRNTKGNVPPLGHIRFIITCAQMAQMALHITDIAVPRQEFIDALWEAGMRNDADYYTLHPEELAPCTSRASLREQPQPQKRRGSKECPYLLTHYFPPHGVGIRTARMTLAFIFEQSGLSTLSRHRLRSVRQTPKYYGSSNLFSRY